MVVVVWKNYASACLVSIITVQGLFGISAFEMFRIISFGHRKPEWQTKDVLHGKLDLSTVLRKNLSIHVTD